ncbi:sensor histidine kinase [Paenibacillus sp. N4]|uniref:sensor histidine kinase n=1 Tax=Paenibacillus vietnamensis TaxID=2590547 RepID=UPI001CD06286|nr:sensor histidine kinase [Paenibacillus vietnamensis]MCA0755820.1 sensor histidine kinase [Paenibacillus vietnamensis]
MKFKDMPVIAKLYICIAFFIILPLILVGFYLNIRFAELTLSKASESALQTLKQTKQNFETLAADTNDISLRILSNQGVQQFIQGGYLSTSEFEQAYLDVDAWMDDIIGSKPYYDAIHLYSEKELRYQRGIDVPEMSETNKSYASELQGKGFWVTAPHELSFYRAIMDFGKLGRTIGYEKFTINEELLYDFYKNINSVAGSQIFLIDQTGLVLSSSVRDLIGDRIGVVEPIQRALRLKEDFFKIEIEGEKLIILFYTIKDMNLTLVQSIPESSFSTLKTTVNTVLLVVFSLCILFGILFSLVQYKYLLKPLQKLRKEMAKLKTGNFNISLDIDSRDEIGEIGNGFLRMTEQLKDTINDVYIGKIKQREAEITALQSQINPHFLYNTLDSIHWLAVKRKNYDVSEQIEALAEIFRHVLNNGEPLVTVRQELDFLESYMFLQQRKYGDRIKLHMEADPDLMSCRMPKLVLQPLVENAILHGLEQIVEGGHIEVEIAKAAEGIRFMVSDNGAGTDEMIIRQMMESDHEAKHVFALKNIDDRIKLSYGQGFGLTFRSKIGIGTRVEVLIPQID